MDRLEGVQYAEISFPCHQAPGHSSAGTKTPIHYEHQHLQYQQNCEYAKIEFAKASRVAVVGGSPKFESTV